jgi:hypothetical protein
MSWTKFLKDFVNKSSNKSKDMEALRTEEDILSAIDMLPSEITNEKKETVETEETKKDWYKDTNYVKVTSPKCYSKFEYIKTADFYGLPKEKDDTRPHFLIPCGLEWDGSLKFWFMTFPANGTSKDITEFFTAVNPMES